MLLPRPPIFVGRRRAVAEMIVAIKQVAPIAVGHVYPLPGIVAVPARPPADTPPPVSQSGHDTPL